MRDISEGKCLCCPKDTSQNTWLRKDRGRWGRNYGKFCQCHVCCRGWKAAQGPGEGQTQEESALCVPHGTTVGVLILA